MKIYTVGAKHVLSTDFEQVVIEQGIEEKSKAIRLAKKVNIVIDECWEVYLLEVDISIEKAVSINFKD